MAETYRNYEIGGYGFSVPVNNFDVAGFDELITRLQTKTSNAFKALEIIQQNSIEMSNIIGSNENKLSSQWNEIAETISNIRNKSEEISLSFINMLSSYKKKTLENEADWSEDISKSEEYLTNINDKLNSI